MPVVSVHFSIVDHSVDSSLLAIAAIYYMLGIWFLTNILPISYSL